MEFYNHIHCKYTGIKGFLTVYNDALRHQYMITKKALEKAEFWRSGKSTASEPPLTIQGRRNAPYGFGNAS